MKQITIYSLAKTGLLSTVLFGFAQTATATPKMSDAKRGEIVCFPAKGVPKIVERLNKIDAKRRDVVDVKLDPRFLIKDSGVWPDAFYLARDGEIVTQMPFSRENGRVPNFLKSVQAAPDTDICVADPTRADKPKNDEGLYFEMGLSPLFQSATGEHEIAVLDKGARDAKRFYKKMVPAVFRMFIPDINYLAVKYQDPALQVAGASAAIYARVDGQEIALESERHKEMFVVSGKALRDMGASALIIRGGDYDLLPVPSPEAMRRFERGRDGPKPDAQTANFEN